MDLQNKKQSYKRPEPQKGTIDFITCDFCGCFTNAKLRRCCKDGYIADGGKRHCCLHDESDVKHPLEKAYESGEIVHVFAGVDGGVVVPIVGESLLDRMERARHLSKNGDVLITPHYC